MSPTTPTPKLWDGDQPLRPLGRYVRVSRVGARDEANFNSPRDQELELDRDLARRGWSGSQRVYVDLDKSGGTFSRPAWAELVADVKAGELAGVDAMTFARLSRADFPEMVDAFREIEDAGGRVYTVGRDSAWSVRGDDGMFTMMEGWRSSGELRSRRADNSRTRRNAIASGVHLGIPVGYRRPRLEADGQVVVMRGRPLELDPAAAEHVRAAFELRAGGASYGAIVDMLTAAGVKPGRAKVWRHQSVRSMLRSRVYTGIAYSGAPEAGGFERDDAHPAIVSRELFERVQATFGTMRGTKSEPQLLAGLAKCDGCGYNLVSYASRENGQRYYRCRPTFHGEGRCTCPANVRADELEALVIERALDMHAQRYDAARDTSDASELALQVADALVEFEAAMERSDRLSTSSQALRAKAEERVDAVAQRVEELERQARVAQRRELGNDLPEPTTFKAFMLDPETPAADVRASLATLLHAVVVRRSATWREPVALRTRLIDADAWAPRDSGAIRDAIAGGSVPTGAWVAAA